MSPGDELELAKAGLEELGETGREMVRLASRSSVAREAAALLADEIRYWRFKREVKIVRKAERLLDEAGMSAHPIPLKLLVPLLDWGGLETEEELVDLWANLLASAGSMGDVHVSYPELLRQLEWKEAALIEGLFAFEVEFAIRVDGDPPNRGILKFKSGAWRTLDHVLDRIDVDAVDIDARSVKNLVRLGLCDARNDENFMMMGRGMRRDSEKARATDGPEICLTALGLDFARACQPPGRFRN